VTITDYSRRVISFPENATLVIISLHESTEYIWLNDKSL